MDTTFFHPIATDIPSRVGALQRFLCEVPLRGVEYNTACGNCTTSFCFIFVLFCTQDISRDHILKLIERYFCVCALQWKTILHLLPPPSLLFCPSISVHHFISCSSWLSQSPNNVVHLQCAMFGFEHIYMAVHKKFRTKVYCM